VDRAQDARGAAHVGVRDDRRGDLVTEPLLYLRAGGALLLQAGELGEADDARGRQVGNRRRAAERSR
jgi:hypothetical protein